MGVVGRIAAGRWREGWIVYGLVRMFEGYVCFGTFGLRVDVYVWVKASTPLVGISNEEKKDEGDCSS